MEYSSLKQLAFTTKGTRVPYEITQRYLDSTEVTFPPLPQPIKTGTQFSDPGGMQG